MKKFKVYASLGCILAIFACSENSSTSPGKVEDNTPFGWLEGGFTPETRFDRGGGLQKVAHSGDWIVLMDAWTSPVDSNDTLFGNYTYTPRLFISKIGSDHWDTVVPPPKTRIKILYADEDGIYVGTYGSAEILRYIPSQKSWDVKKLKDSLNKGEWYHIYGIGRFQGRLIVSMVGYRDSISEKNNNLTPFVMWENGSGWDSIDASPRLYKSTTKDDSSTDPFFFSKGVEWNGKFYVTTEDNVWSLDATGKRWTKLPEISRLIPGFRDFQIKRVVDLVLHKNRLYALDGIENTVFMLDELSQSWKLVDSLRYDGDTTSDNYIIVTNTPAPLQALVSDGNHLFVAGGNPEIPMVYMGDYGEPYGSIPKGWRLVGHWCKNFYCFPSGGGTYSIDIVGDTLYVANWKNFLKFPLDKLDSAIANENDYR